MTKFRSELKAAALRAEEYSQKCREIAEEMNLTALELSVSIAASRSAMYKVKGTAYLALESLVEGL